MNRMILDVGCGNKKRPGAIGIDISNRTQADVLHDLNAVPYPFPDSQFDEIYIDNVLEHLVDVVAVMEELYRISKPGGMIKVVVPYFRSRWAFIDPTHRRFFTADSMTYFDPDHIHAKLYPYSTIKLKTEKRIFNENIPGGFMKKLMVRFANRFTGAYECWLSHLCPLDDLTWYLKVIK